MSGEGDGLKLFNNKPKKPKSNASTPISTAAPPPPPPPPPPQPRKESFVRRYKFLWPLLLGVNFAVGAYVLLRTRQKNKDSLSESETPEAASSTTTSSSAPASIVEQPTLTPPTIKEPIPEDQQRELFKWILEEKRKLKPKDAEEKKAIDEEKAILKQFIRAKSIPTI